MDFHGINASVRTGIYSMVPLTPAFPAREIINVSSSTAAAYADPRAWDERRWKITALQARRKRAKIEAKSKQVNGGHTMLTKEDLQALQVMMETVIDKKLEPIKQDLSEVKGSLAEVREATNYIAE